MKGYVNNSNVQIFYNTIAATIDGQDKNLPQRIIKPKTSSTFTDMNYTWNLMIIIICQFNLSFPTWYPIQSPIHYSIIHVLNIIKIMIKQKNI